MQNSLYKLFDHNCVISVCTHPSYNDKIHPVFYLKNVIRILKSPFSTQAVLRFLSESRSSAQAAPTRADRQGRLTLGGFHGIIVNAELRVS